MGKSADRVLAAERFVEEWHGRGQEDEHDETFWNQFLQEVMGIDRVHHIIDYQKKVKIGRSTKKIDGFIPTSKVLIEQKTCGINLKKPAVQSDGQELTPYEQGLRYAAYLPTNETPDFIIVSNFQEFLIYDRRTDPNGESPIEVSLEELPQQLQVFNFIVDPVNQKIARQQQVNLDAAKLIGEVYESIKNQYHDPDSSRHDLATLMVRVLFCLYAEDSGLFEHGLFYYYLKGIPAGEGVFRDALIKLFKVLNTPEDKRDTYLGETLSQFPYVNGGLFADDIEIPIFTDSIKFQMLQKAGVEFNWSEISPVIFGSIFESILSGDERRAGGMHYTSVENIHKVIDPLFLDELHLEFHKAGNNKAKLRELQDKIASLNFLDPACGSGNFLTQTYLELRALENSILGRLIGDQMAMELQAEDFPSFVKVNVGQFYGIEINDFAVSVANTALWIADHQANQQTAKLINRPVVNLPLKDYRHIVCANALRIDWNEVLLAEKCNYIMGNPPFLGARNQSEEQKQEILDAFDGAKNAGNIDYVAGWYMKATKYIDEFEVACAFVSTNSICQGEQVANIWGPLMDLGIHIFFAHKTFRWTSEAPGMPHVFVVVVGFSKQKQKRPLLFHYETPDSAPVLIRPCNINPYLSDAPDSFILNRQEPICDVPRMGIGNKPIDGGFYLFNEDEMLEFLKKEPVARRFFHPWIGAEEFINNKKRYVLWLGNSTAQDLKDMPLARERIKAVREYRLASKSMPTQKLAETPTRFHVENMPKGNSILIPEVSSERRVYIPIGFVGPEVMCSSLVKLIPNATLYHFGIITSQIHNAWMRVVAGRLKSDYRYSIGVVYNNFIWPNPTDKQRIAIEEYAQAILYIRENYSDSSLAEMYNPDYDFLYPDLISAHKVLDSAVEQAYGVNFGGDEERVVAHLFKLYDAKTKEERS